jgi:hypothetical protein
VQNILDDEDNSQTHPVSADALLLYSSLDPTIHQPIPIVSGHGKTHRIGENLKVGRGFLNTLTAGHILIEKVAVHSCCDSCHRKYLEHFTNQLIVPIGMA